MKEYLVHISTNSFEFVEVKATSPEEAKEVRDSVIAAFLEPKTTPNLQPIPFLRLLHKYMVENRLEMEDVESLGTDKLYSQKDVVNLIKNVFAKIARDSGTNRINKEEDVRYN